MMAARRLGEICRIEASQKRFADNNAIDKHSPQGRFLGDIANIVVRF
jgi:hypothetical protein